MDGGSRKLLRRFQFGKGIDPDYIRLIASPCLY